MSTQRTSRSTTALGLMVPDHWTPEQALAVIELLDDLREFIFSHYLIPIQEALRDDRSTIAGEHLSDDDPKSVPI